MKLNKVPEVNGCKGCYYISTSFNGKYEHCHRPNWSDTTCSKEAIIWKEVPEKKGYECPVCRDTFMTGVGYVQHNCNKDIHDEPITIINRAEYDPIEKPEGYNQGEIECIDYIADKKMDYFEGNIVKYVTRHKFKNGKDDIKKVKKYAELMIDRYEGLYGES